jgi:4-hydroxybenzoate polyprenyltransferase
MTAFVSVPLLSVLGTFICWSIAKYLDSPWSIETAIFCVATILTVYFANKSTDLLEDFVNNKIHQHDKNKCLTIAIILGIGCYLYSSFKQMNIMYISILLTGFLYSFRLIPTIRTDFIRIKDIPVLKNLVVSFYWSVPTVMIPFWVAKKEVNISSDAITLMIILGVSTFVSTIISDVIDEKGDRVAGIKTLPVLFGGKKTLNILKIWLFIIGISTFIVLYFKHEYILSSLVVLLLQFLNLNMTIAKSNFKFKNVLVDADLLLIGSYLLIAKTIKTI